MRNSSKRDISAMVQRMPRPQQRATEDIRFSKLFENSHDGITLLDDQLNVIYRSCSAERIIGWSTAERVKSTLIGLVHTDDQAKLRKGLMSLLKNPGKSVTCSYRARHLAGHFIWLECVFTNMLGEPGINAIVCNFRDISEKKQHEELLKNRAKQFEELLESITDGFIALDKDMRYTYANKRIGEMIGIDPDSLIGKNVWELFPEAIGSSTYNAIQTAITEQKYICNEDHYAPLNLWQENRIFPSGDGISMFIRDITERKNLEDLLKKANDLARIGGWEVDLEASTVYWSDITREIHEAEPDFTPDIETATNFYKEGESRNTVIKIMEGAVKNCSHSDEELQIVTAKGKTKWVRVIVEAEFKDGKCKRIYGSFQDIDARKRAEMAEIKALEEKTTILESIGDAFFVVDNNWTVTYWNHTAEKVQKMPKDEIVGRSLWEVYPDAIGSESYKKYHEAMETDKVTRFEDYYPPLKNWYEICAYPSANGLSVYFKDITERHNHIKAIEEQYRKLKEISWMQSHVIRAPLARIMGLIPLLTDAAANADEKETALKYLLISAHELDDVIRSISEKSIVPNSDQPSE